MLAMPMAASARVGVTSATDGDPLGKPPAEAERILRIGIDVQANELITTGTNDRAHLVFLDGTSLTVGPNARLTIDKFVYDPNTKTGDLAVTASKGVLRLVGGKISKTHPVTITTPSSTIGIRGGITIVDVQPSHTTSTFVFGNNMTVSAHGQSQNCTRPGTQVTTNSGSAPGAPTLVPQGGLSNQMGQLEGNKSGGSSSGTGSGGGSGSSGPAGGAGTSGNQQANAEQGAQNFGSQNSGKGTGVGGPPTGPNGPGPGNGNPNNGPNNNQNNLTNAVSNGQQQGQRQTTSVTTTTTTTVVVSRGSLGRYIGSTPYKDYGTFGSNPLQVNYDTDQYKTVSSPSDQTTRTTTTTVTNGNGTTTSSTTTRTITITVPGKGTVTLPWKTNTLANGFSIDNLSALGDNLRSGMGYVSPQGEFFAYVFTTTGSNKIGVFGGTPTNSSGTSNFPTSGVGTFSIANIGNNGRLPFTNDTVGGNSDLSNAKVVSSLYTAWSSTLSSTIGQPIPDARATALQASISISGTGDQQKSYIGVFIGQFLRDVDVNGSGTVTRDNGQYLAGNFDATYRLSSNLNNSDGKIGRLVSQEATPSTGSVNSNNVGSNTGNAIYGTPGNDGAVGGFILTPDSMTSSNAGGSGGGNVTSITTSRTPQVSLDQPYTNISGSAYYSVTGAYKTTTSDTVGVNRTSQTLSGFVGGIVEQVDSSGNTFSTRAVTSSDPTKLQLTTDPTTNRASATISLNATDGYWDTANSTNTSAVFKLGGTTSSNVSTSAFIDDNIYALRDRSQSMGNSTTVAGSDSNVTSNTFMVSYNTAPVDNLIASGDKCTCSFMTWGWWSGDVAYNSSSTYNASGRDRMNLATYIAGTISNVTQLPNTGSATYKGFMVGGVDANGKQYLASGSYQNVWSFASRQGAVTASFDGASFSGSTNVTSNAQFSASINNGSKTLNLNGAFMGSGTPPAGQGGAFSISNNTGASYKAAGIFAGQKQ